MRRWGIFAALMLLLGTLGQAQVTVQVVPLPPPATWTYTVAPINYYQSTAKSMTITVTAGVVALGCTATWDTTNLSLSFPTSLTNPVAITAAVTSAMTAATGSHTVTFSCPQVPPPVLTLKDPVKLPNAKVGTPYSASLAPMTGVSGGVTPYTWSLIAGSLPGGLSLSSSGQITGTPSGVGVFNLTYMVQDSTVLSRRLYPINTVPWTWDRASLKSFRISE